MKPLLDRGKVHAIGTELRQFDEHSEDESLTGNSEGKATNSLIIAEFRLGKDCIEVARIINEVLENRNKQKSAKSKVG